MRTTQDSASKWCILKPAKNADESFWNKKNLNKMGFVIIDLNLLKEGFMWWNINYSEMMHVIAYLKLTLKEALKFDEYSHLIFLPTDNFVTLR